MSIWDTIIVFLNAIPNMFFLGVLVLGTTFRKIKAILL